MTARIMPVHSTLLLCLALFASTAWSQCSPIVVDLDMAGIDLGEAGVGVYFDVNADGIQDHVQWVRPAGDEVFLSLDRNGNGIVDDGSELFGVGTPLLIEGGTAPNGFVGLAQYDAVALGGNDDGLITSADAIWNELRVWHDVNADGISLRSEMLTLEEAGRGLIALETIPKVRKYYDDAGNAIPYWAWVFIDSARRKKTEMVDVFFLMLPEQMAWCPEAKARRRDSSRNSAG